MARFINPLRGKNEVTVVGGRRQDFQRHVADGRPYPGTDIMTYPNYIQDILAIEDGYCMALWDNGDNTAYVQLNGVSGLRWIYAHLTRGTVTGNVTQGQVVGQTGRDHLHLGMIEGGQYQDAEKYLDFNSLNIDMNDFEIIISKKANDIGDSLRRAGVEDPGNASQKQNVANLNRKWWSATGAVKQHNGTYQDMERQLQIGDIVRVRGTPNDSVVIDQDLEKLKKENENLKNSVDLLQDANASLAESQQKLNDQIVSLQAEITALKKQRNIFIKIYERIKEFLGKFSK